MKKTKTCTRCKVRKGVTKFYNHPKMSDGLQSHCKECHHEYQRKKTKNNPGWQNARIYAWRAKKNGQAIDQTAEGAQKHHFCGPEPKSVPNS